jgi:hypothetical protein
MTPDSLKTQEENHRALSDPSGVLDLLLNEQLELEEKNT